MHLYFTNQQKSHQFWKFGFVRFQNHSFSLCTSSGMVRCSFCLINCIFLFQKKKNRIWKRSLVGKILFLRFIYYPTHTIYINNKTELFCSINFTLDRERKKQQNIENHKCIFHKERKRTTNPIQNHISKMNSGK